MGYGSVYEAVYDLYDPEVGWDAMVTLGSRESLNIVEESLWRHQNSGEIGLRLRDFESGEYEAYGYAELAQAAGRFANYLEATTGPRARVAALLPARYELYAVVYGTIASGRVYVPLAPLFGPDAAAYRLRDAGAELLVTTTDHAAALDTTGLPDLHTVLTTDPSDVSGTDDTTISAYDTITDHPAAYDPVRTHPRDIYAITYTSGTAGQPKGCPKHHGRAAKHHAFLEYVVDLRPTDTYFCAASPAWSYGLHVGTISAGLRDTAIGCYRGPFDPERFLETVEHWGVTNLMAPPTALRQLRAADLDPAAYDIDLRVLVSAGEALDHATVEWCATHLGTEPLDAYGLTEGGMAVCNYGFPDWTVKPGSMGRPTPGYDVRLVTDEGTTAGVDEVGEIAIRREPDAGGWYWGRPADAIERFSGTWLRTGDLARRDADGYYWYVSRTDDVIISAGYRIGPEEVEATLLNHEAVEEAAVVGIPDDTRGQIVCAYVTLTPGTPATEETKREIQTYARDTLSRHEYPREVRFIVELPKTPTGKIKRTALPGTEE